RPSGPTAACRGAGIVRPSSLSTGNRAGQRGCRWPGARRGTVRQHGPRLSDAASGAPAPSSVLGAAYPVQPVGHLGRVLDDLAEPHDGHDVVDRDLLAVDLLEEVDHLLVAAELGVVVLDVAG